MSQSHCPICQLDIPKKAAMCHACSASYAGLTTSKPALDVFDIVSWCAERTRWAYRKRRERPAAQLVAPDELNPNNPVLTAARGNWHKIAALVMHKLGCRHVEIKSEDVDAFNKDGLNVGIADSKGYMEVFLLNEEETAAKVAQQGGLPSQS